MRKKFLKTNPKKQREILNILLWNSEVRDKKIANITYKQPYDIPSKIKNKSDFSLMQRRWDVLER